MLPVDEAQGEAEGERSGVADGSGEALGDTEREDEGVALGEERGDGDSAPLRVALPLRLGDEPLPQPLDVAEGERSAEGLGSGEALSESLLKALPLALPLPQSLPVARVVAVWRTEALGRKTDAEGEGLALALGSVGEAEGSGVTVGGALREGEAEKRTVWLSEEEGVELREGCAEELPLGVGGTVAEVRGLPVAWSAVGEV